MNDIETCGPKPAECTERQEDNSDSSATDYNDNGNGTDTTSGTTNAQTTTSAATTSLMIGTNLSLIVVVAVFLVATLN